MVEFDGFVEESDSDDYISDEDFPALPEQQQQQQGSSRVPKCHKCDKCDIGFARSSELKKHMLEDSSGVHSYCEPCDTDFSSRGVLKMHLIESDAHNDCLDCGKSFKSPGGLNIHRKQMHRNSTKSMKCPGCFEMFPGAAALVQHVESRLCIDKELSSTFQTKLNKANDISLELSRMSLDCEISPSAPGPFDPALYVPPVKSNMNAAGSKSNQLTHLPGLDGSVARRELKVVDYEWKEEFNQEQYHDVEEMETFWNPMFKMFTCPHYRVCKKKYARKEALMQHLNSPAHAIKRFRCPKCNDLYKTSSALLQHIESESCGITNPEVREALIHNLTGGLSTGKGEPAPLIDI